MESSRKKRIWPVVALLWFVGVVLMYYVSHKPITADVMVNLGMLLWRLGVTAVIVSAGGAVGSLFFKGSEVHALTRAALQAALGLGVFALAALLVGSLVGVNWLFFAVIALTGMALFRRVRDWWQNWGSLKTIWLESDGFGRTGGALCAILMLCALAVALAPPLWFDALSTHLLLPQAYLNDGEVAYLPWQVMSGMPQNMEMLFMVAMSAADGQAATAVGWAVAVLATVGLLGSLYSLFGARTAWAGTAALLAGYSMVMLSAAGYVDWLALLFGLGTVVLLHTWRKRGGRDVLWTAGVFTGLAVGSKYTAGVIAIAGLGALLWHAYQRKDKVLVRGLEYGTAALVVFLPWLIKNWITTGNPIYPFFFGGGAMTDLRMQVWQNVPIYGNWLDVVLLPIRATYLGIEGAPGYMVAVGPLLLGLGALAWIGHENHSEDQRAAFENAAWIAGLGVLVWVLGSQYSGRLIQTRYYFVLFPAFVLLAGFGYRGVSGLSIGQLRLRRILNAFVLLVMVFNLLEVGAKVVGQDAWRAASGARSEKDYVADNLGWYQPAMWAIRDLPVGNRVLLLYEARGYYCAPTCVADEVLDRWKGDWDTNRNDEAILEAWREEGFTHVMAYSAGMEFLRTGDDPNHPAEDIEALEQLLEKMPLEADFGGAYDLYEIP